jgi:hypothetical protein
MAKSKKLKYPKKPKKTASVQVKENWLKRCKEIDKKNAEREKSKKKSESLSNQIANHKRK